MANVHRIGDIENDNYNRMGPGGAGGNMQQDMMRLRQMNIPFMNQEEIPPRKESFWDMLRLNFCPRLKLISFTVFVTIINLILFIITSCQENGIQRTKDSQFLQQNTDVLKRFGANYPYNIKHHGEVWRLITAAFLHANFFHILFNTLSTFIFVSSIERSYGIFITFVMWILCGIGGNIFSADFASSESISVGASTSLFGMAGLYIAFIILNWKALEFLQQLRCMLLCIVWMMVIMIFLMSSSSYGSPSQASQGSKIDNYGHLGGFLTGLLAGVVIPKPIQSGEYEKHAKYFCGFLLALFFILSFTLFFTATDI